MPQTTNKGYEVQTTGSNTGTWGDVLNDNMITYVDTNMGGLLALSLSNSDVMLTTDQARNCVIRCTGSLSADIIITNSCIGFYFVENLCTGAHTVIVTNGVGGVIVAAGTRVTLIADSSNGVRIASGGDLPSGTCMLFHQSTAPVGWTIRSSGTYDDIGVRVLSSSGGGVHSGSVFFSTLFARTAVDGHILTIAETPAHTHTYATPTTSTVINIAGATDVLRTSTSSGTTGSTGGGNSHAHNIDMRISYADVIVADKD